jgi:hypothetical protein
MPRLSGTGSVPPLPPARGPKRPVEHVDHVQRLVGVDKAHELNLA